MPIKVALIGCGWMAQNGHGPALQAYAKANPTAVELCACCDIDAKQAADFAKTFGFARSYTDMNALLDAEQPGYVCLVVPVHRTAPMALEVMRRNIPILLEKPPGMNIQEAEQLLAAGAKVPHRVAFNRRYAPLMTRLCDELKKTGQDILSLRCEFLRINRCDHDFSSTAIHGIDAVQCIAGAYEKLDFSYREVPDANPGTKPGPAHFVLSGSMRSGAAVSLNFSPMSGVLAERYTVELFDHTFAMHLPGGLDAGGCLRHWHKGNLVKEVAGGELNQGMTGNFIEGGFYHENASFLDALQAKKPITGGMADGAIDPMRIADAIRERQRHLILPQ